MVFPPPIIVVAMRHEERGAKPLHAVAVSDAGLPQTAC